MPWFKLKKVETRYIEANLNAILRDLDEFYAYDKHIDWLKRNQPSKKDELQHYEFMRGSKESHIRHSVDRIKSHLR